MTDPSQEPATVSEHQTYMKVAGSIQYIACVTRPDLAFAAHSPARHMSASSKEQWMGAQHVEIPDKDVMIHASAGVATSAQAMA